MTPSKRSRSSSSLSSSSSRTRRRSNKKSRRTSPTRYGSLAMARNAYSSGFRGNAYANFMKNFAKK